MVSTNTPPAATSAGWRWMPEPNDRSRTPRSSGSASMKQDGQPGRSCVVHLPAWHGSSVRDQISIGANRVKHARDHREQLAPLEPHLGAEHAHRSRCTIT